MHYQCHLPINPDDSRAHVGRHILRAMCGVREPNLHEQVVLPDPCGFCGRSNCQVDLLKSGKSYKATSTCPRQHQFSYGYATRLHPQMSL
ncbi:hypothetical protein B0H10DRAFT_1837933 [Mycena sp. CBHHK59/15]|nr:hypothetical protein B0H10DRAFT_1837933 [Mycena sp. CBHHK59/15]